MQFIYEIYDSIKVGTLGYEEEILKQSIRNAGNPHDVDGPQIVIYEFYNHTSKNSIGYTSAFSDRKEVVTGVGKCLIRKLAEVAESKLQSNIYVVGAKRQAWETYRSLTFRPLGTNILNWYARTDNILMRTKGAEIIVRTMQSDSPALRAPSSLFTLALAAMAREQGAKPSDDPKDPRTNPGQTINRL